MEKMTKVSVEVLRLPLLMPMVATVHLFTTHSEICCGYKLMIGCCKEF